MADRLSDEELVRLEQRIGSEFDNEATLTGDELRVLLAELRERRSQDLTAEEREALALVHVMLMGVTLLSPAERSAGMAVIAKILNGTDGRTEGR